MGNDCSCIKGQTNQAPAPEIIHEAPIKQLLQTQRVPESDEFDLTPQKETHLKATHPQLWVDTALATLASPISKAKQLIRRAGSRETQATLGFVSANGCINPLQARDSDEVQLTLQSIVRGYLARKHSHQLLAAKAPPKLKILPEEDVSRLISHSKITQVREQLGELYLEPLDSSTTLHTLGAVKRGSLIYLSEWTSDGKTYGRGSIFAPHKYCYEGYIVDNRKEVFGRIIFADGSHYIGCFSKDYAEGEGKYRHSSGAVLDGVFHKGRIVTGVETRPEGVQYKGQFLQWKWHGHGSLRLPDGSHYAGEFAEGMFHGKGTLEMASGNQYQGKWKYDRMHGVGRFTWSDGSVYDGEYVNDLKHGYGQLTTSDGVRYRGGWKDGKRHGKAREDRMDSAGKLHRRIRVWKKGILQD